ncbi:MAG: MotA/TolQ/ExbB proton channel family protein [bacterium]
MEGILNFLDKGGPVLWVIIGLSLIVFTFIIERFLFFHRIRKDEELLFPLKELLNKNTLSERMKEDLELLIMREEPRFLRFLDFIAVSTTAAPILGLLGTVTGMIKVFDALSRLGSPDAHLLAKGISEALITTEAGLVIAIPCLFLHNILLNKAENNISRIKHEGMRLIALVDEEKKKA